MLRNKLVSLARIRLADIPQRLPVCQGDQLINNLKAYLLDLHRSSPAQVFKVRWGQAQPRRIHGNGDFLPDMTAVLTELKDWQTVYHHQPSDRYTIKRHGLQVIIERQGTMPASPAVKPHPAGKVARALVRKPSHEL